MLERYIKIVDLINGYTGRVLAWCLPLIVFVTLTVVLFSSLFRMGWVWMSEIVIYLHAILFMLAAGYTLQHNDHVRVDVFYGKMSLRCQAWVNLLGVFLLLLPVCLVIFWTSFSYVADSWSVMEHSQEGQGLPTVFLLKTCILIMPVLLIMQGLAIAAKSYLYIRTTDSK